MINSMKLLFEFEQKKLFRYLSLLIMLFFSIFILPGCDFIIDIMAFHPDSIDVIPTERLPSNVHEVFIKTEDNLKIQSYYIPKKTSDILLIYFHGNGGNMGHRLYDLRQINSFGINVLGISYRGYGKSQGKPSEMGIYIDGKAALGYSNQILGFPMEKIFIFGRSIGTTVAINTAQNLNIGGLILVSPLTSGKAHAKVSGLSFVSFLAGDAFNNIDKIINVKCPVLVIHGTQDDLIPFAMGEELFNRVKTKKKFIKIQGANHNDLSTQYYEPYWSAVDEFIKHNRTIKREK